MRWPHNLRSQAKLMREEMQAISEDHMHRFFFTAEYNGATLRDDDGELFPTEAQAIAHARVIASELGRNNSRPVSVSVLDKTGLVLATARAGAAVKPDA